MPTLTASRIRQIRGLITHLRRATARQSPVRYRRDAVGYLGLSSHVRQSHGACKWCGRRVPPPNRYWHDQCAVAYRVARGVQSDSYRIAHLRERHYEQCDSKTEPLELDHRIALSVAYARGDWRSLLRAYDISNLRWLCHHCHAGQDRRGSPAGQQFGRRQAGGLEPLPTASRPTAGAGNPAHPGQARMPHAPALLE